MSRSRTNRLIREKSPYLLQHAENPVDWYPWGEEAFARARAEDRPILLSVGYSACHWCHVMERESFEDEQTAALMNDFFVCVKVDREERPDVDQIYQHAVQMLTGQGGWPLTVFLTPDGKPFFGGTYFPPDERYGRPSFKRVLQALADAWKARRSDVEANVHQIMGAIARLNDLSGYGMLAPAIADEATAHLLQRVDSRHGGFLGAPKFPNATSLSFLLGRAVRKRDPRARDAVLLALRRMAQGGIYDQIGGGFHRYSVDDHWLVPHFEKMLYDNALLARLYLDAWYLCGDPLLRRIANETLAYALREMRSPEGGFYASQDADSEGEEGKFFAWSPGEIEKVVGPENAAVLCAHFGVTPQGNFEHGRSVLSIARDVEEVARSLDRTPAEVERIVAEGKRALFRAREKRVKPHRDEKILTSWNALMIAALARSPDPEHVAAASAAATFVLSRLRKEGRLLRSYKDGEARHAAVLDDHSFLADALVDLYHATFEARWLSEALAIADVILERFHDPGGKSFYLTAPDVDLVHRPRAVFDQAIPSGAGVACRALLRLGALSGRRAYEDAAVEVLRNYAEPMRENPFGFGSFLEALDGHLRGHRTVAIFGPDNESTRELATAARRRFDPDLLVCRVPDGGAEGLEAVADLVRARANGRSGATVCRAQTCSLPVTTPEDLEALLAE